MIRLVMEGAGLTIWPVLSFIIFFASCMLMLLWLYRPGSAPIYRRMARMALDGETGNGKIQREDG